MTRSTRAAGRQPATAAVLAAGLLLTGCGGGAGGAPQPASTLHCPADPRAPFVVAVGARSNSAAPVLPEDVTGRLYETARAGAPVSFVRVDGAPQRVFTGRFSTDAGNQVARDNAYRTFAGQLQHAFAQDTHAAKAEADPLAAITLAAREAAGSGTVVLADSGLQTVAPLRFQDGLLTADPAEIVDYLKKRDLLPDLRNQTVIFVGLAETADPQPALDAHLHRNVLATWRAIAAAANAACIDVVDRPLDRRPVSGALPAVSVVQPPAPPAPPRPCGETVLGEANDVGFVQDRDVFRDPAAARQTIGTVADVLRGGRQTAELVGTTADVGPYPGQVQLSRQRAAAVARVLAELGVAASRVRITALGSRFPDYVTDHAADGALLPGPAARNRKVIVRLTCPRG